MHALLGNLLAYQNDGRKKTPPQTWQDFTRNFDFHQSQKNCDLPKRLLQKTTLAIKATNEPEQKFWKTWHNQKTTTLTKPIKNHKLNLPETLQKENEPILKTYINEPETKPKATKQSQSKFMLTKTQTENLEVSFSDSTKPTRTFANEKNAAKRKSRELENLLAENQTQTQIWKTPPLKTEFAFSNSTIKRNLRIKDDFAFALGCLTAGVTRKWAGWDSLREQEKLEARKLLENAAESHLSGARFVGWR